MAALTHLCTFPQFPGLNFQPIDDFSIDNEFCKYYDKTYEYYSYVDYLFTVYLKIQYPHFPL